MRSAMRHLPTIATPATDESGMTIVEVLIAAIVLTISALAVLGLTDAATRNTYRAEQSQVVVDRLQAELEHIRQLPYDQVALTRQPSHSTDPASPARRVSITGTQFAIDRGLTGSKPLAYAGGNTPGGQAVGCVAPDQGSETDPACDVDPGPEPFESGDVKGQIYRYVVYPGAPADCTGCSDDDFKQVIVAIHLDTTASGGAHAYQEIQSTVANPEAVPSSNPTDPTPPTDHQIGAFWLTDTSCNQTSRQPLTGNHLTHNTHGTCQDPTRTDGIKGAPDLMFNQRPLDSDADPRFLYDYATDFGESSDIGLAIPSSSTANGCLLSVMQSAPSLNRTIDLPTGEAPQAMHLWLSNPLNPTFAALTSADATLELWTRGVDGGGQVCISMVKRVTVQQVIGTQSATFVVDAPAVMTTPTNAPAACDWTAIYASCAYLTWPQQWTKISVPMKLTMQSATDVMAQLTSAGVPGTLSLVGQPRIGLGMSVERQNTSGGGLEFMYDHPTFESKLEVDTPLGVCIVSCTP
jgi:type II secretory pathway pseudopilin PulG